MVLKMIVHANMGTTEISIFTCSACEALHNLHRLSLVPVLFCIFLMQPFSTNSHAYLVQITSFYVKRKLPQESVTSSALTTRTICAKIPS